MVAWSSRGFVTFVLLSVGLLWVTSAPVGAQTSAEQEVASSGKPAFNQHCAQCHGLDGKGGGPASNLLTMKPSDLTMISKKNNGTFPFWRIYGIVDSREDVKGHGTRDMPIWGAEFRGQTGSGAVAEAQVRGRILELVYYLQSIQAK